MKDQLFKLREYTGNILMSDYLLNNIIRNLIARFERTGSVSVLSEEVLSVCKSYFCFIIQSLSGHPVFD